MYVCTYIHMYNKETERRQKKKLGGDKRRQKRNKK